MLVFIWPTTLPLYSNYYYTTTTIILQLDYNFTPIKRKLKGDESDNDIGVI